MSSWRWRSWASKITAPERPQPLTAEEKDAARLNPSLNRGLYAIAIGLRPEGVREWNYATNLHKSGGMTDRELLAAAQFACDREVWDRCINTSERTRDVVDAWTSAFPCRSVNRWCAAAARSGWIRPMCMA
jgi:soluble lytic murein transglycosylase